MIRARPAPVSRRRPATLLAGALLLPMLGGCGLQDFDKFRLDSGSTGSGDGGTDDGGDGGSGSGAVDSGLSGTGADGSSGGGSGSGSDGPDGGTDCEDADGDGVDTCSGDCDDTDPSTHPGAAEAEDPTACMRDADGDGWGDAAATGAVTPGQDCDDSDPALDPEDADGDGASPCAGDCDDTDPRTGPDAAPQELHPGCMVDADGDGWGDMLALPPATAGTDCDDTDPLVNPAATETPFDGDDTDCDGADGGFTTAASGGGGSGYSIRDHTTTTSTATVSTCPQIFDITIGVDIDHSYIGDLDVDLTSPGGITVALHDQGGGSADDIVGSYGSGGGTLTPASSLSPLLGTLGTGVWQLRITDNASYDEGQLRSWNLSLSCY